MIKEKEILFTGGSGLLGTEFKKLMPQADYPSSEVFDVTNYDQMEKYLKDKNIQLIFHAAAFTSPPKVEETPLPGLEVNIIGTSNVVKLCLNHSIKLIYVCTDYVFRGDKGNYQENDPIYPVNKYAWSKLGGECAVRMYNNSLIIRTTFGANVFPYDKAFIDQWTSRESVSVIAKMIYSLIFKDVTGIIHVGGKRKTVYEYAKGLDPSKEIGELSIKNVGFNIPVDTSLNCGRYRDIIEDK